VTEEQERKLADFCPGATGFLMQICGKTLLVSNRHVYSEQKAPLFVRFKKKNGDDVRFPIGLEWRGHPNESIDIAASTIQVPDGMSADDLNTTSFNEDKDRTAQNPQSFIMKFADVRVGDDVMFLGFPTSIPQIREILKNKSTPLLRSGVVSLKLPGETKQSGLTAKDVLLIDSWAFQGNSGSPVFYRPTIGSYSNDRPHLNRSRPYIIGLISAFLPWPAPGGVNSGLAVVESGDGIEQTAAQFPGAKCPPPLGSKSAR
jgi:hypothetical protein